jgi:hypothetical protein
MTLAGLAFLPASLDCGARNANVVARSASTQPSTSNPPSEHGTKLK